MKTYSILSIWAVSFLFASCDRDKLGSLTASNPGAKTASFAADLILAMIEREKQLPPRETEVDGLSWSCKITELKENSATAALAVFSGKSSVSIYKLYCMLENNVWKIDREIQGPTVD